MTQETDSTAVAAILNPGPTDSTYNIKFFEVVDPVVDAWFRYRGRVSRRRFLNIVNMRLKPYKMGKVPDSWIKEYVQEALMPGYRMSWKE